MGSWNPADMVLHQHWTHLLLVWAVTLFVYGASEDEVVHLKEQGGGEGVLSLASAQPRQMLHAGGRQTTSEQLHTFHGVACVAIRSGRVVAEECEPGIDAQSLRYDQRGRRFVHSATGQCLQGGSLEGEVVRAVSCGNQTDGWDIQP